MDEKQQITVSATIQAPAERVWEYYVTPEHLTRWNNASDDWHTTNATSDLRVGGEFKYRMEAKDGSEGFDFGGTYTKVEPPRLLAYTLGDGRTVNITLSPEGDATQVAVTFDTETFNTPEVQRQGWQAILDNFKKYVEKN